MSVELVRLTLDLDSAALYFMGNDRHRELRLTEVDKKGSRAFLEK